MLVRVPSRRQILTGAAAAATASLTASLLTTATLAKAPMVNVQAPSFYRFKVGSFEATVVSDGPLGLGPPSGDVFSGVVQGRDAQRCSPTTSCRPTSFALEQNALVINTGDPDRPVRHRHRRAKTFGPNTGRLLVEPASRRHRPEDVDAIALTHAHPDHCWGLMDDDGARNFPNAQIYMAQADFDSGPTKASFPILTMARSSTARASSCCRTATAWCSCGTARNSCPASRRWRRRAIRSGHTDLHGHIAGKVDLQRRRRRASSHHVDGDGRGSTSPSTRTASRR